MFKRILSFVLCLSILLCSLSMYVYIPAYASVLDFTIYDRYKTIYDGYDFSDIISQHKSFNFTDKGGKKHAVKYGVNGWMYSFGRGGFINNDDTLNYFLSWYAYKGYNSDEGKIGIGIVSLLNSKLGLVASAASDIFDTIMVGTTDFDFEYDEDNGLSISSDSVDKLREEIKKQYYESIGIVHLNIKNERMSFSSTWFEEQDDYTSAYNLINGYDYQFMLDASFYGYDGREIGLYGFNRSAFNYCYLDGTKMCFVDTSLNNIPQADVFNYIPTIYKFNEDVHNSLEFASMYTKNSSYYSRYWDIEYSYKAIKRGSWCSIVYSTKYNDFLFFKSYEALYNYLHGDQNAYLSSKVEETGEDIKISIDDMNTNISDKMDELIDSINSKKDGMNADELQNAIDKGLESISGKMDDIKDNTEETNSKLDNLLSAMQSQNEILLNILGVTTDIYNVVSTKDDEQDKSYNIDYVQAVFNTMFKALKNAVLYGQNTVKQDANQDTDDVNSLVSDVSPDEVDYRDGLFGKFPFSVPYQLYEWLQVLYVEPVAPSFTLSYDFLLKDFLSEEDRQNFKLVIDLNDDKYKEWAELMRSGEKLAFTIYMAVATYNRFKNEV